MSEQYTDEYRNIWTTIDDDFIVNNMIDVYLNNKGVVIRSIEGNITSITSECISETLDYMFSQRVNDYFSQLSSYRQEAIAKRVERYILSNKL